MNKCQFQVQTIKRMSATSGGNMLDPFDYDAVWNSIQNTLSVNSGITENVTATRIYFSGSSIGGGVLANKTMRGGVYYYDKKIYYLTDGYIVSLDTATDTLEIVKTLTDTVSAASGTLYIDKKIYWHGSGKIVQYEPTTDTAEVTDVSDVLYSGFLAVAKNGNLYSFARQAGNIMRYDSINRTALSVGSISNSEQSYGVCPHYNGYVYSAPLATYKMYRLDPSTDAVDRPGSAANNNQHRGTGIGPDGNLYTAAYYNTTNSCIYDITTNTFTNFGSVGNNYCELPKMISNGMLYAFSGTGSHNALRINPYSLTTSSVELKSGNNYNGGSARGTVLTPNAIYLNCNETSGGWANYISKVTINGLAPFNENVYLSPLLNHV